MKEVTSDELLNRMGIKRGDFEDYSKKVSLFLESLNEDEKRFYYRNNGRTVEQIAKSLGPDVTCEDVEKLFDCSPRTHILMLAIQCCGIKNPPPH
jgi:hypothetical protein